MNLVKKNVSFILVVICLISLFSVDALAEEQGVIGSRIEVSWSDNYHKFDEMQSDADIIIYGEIINQESLVLDDGFIYTKSMVQIIDQYKGIESETVIVYQIGGVLGERATQFPDELPKLTQNEECVLICTGDNLQCWIAGAGQGIFYDVEFDNWENVLNRCEEQFILKKRINDYSRAIPETPTNGMAFPSNTTTVYFVYDNSIPSGFSYKTSINNGLKSWQPYVPMTISLSTSVPIGPKVLLYFQEQNIIHPNWYAVTDLISVNQKNIVFYYETVANGMGNSSSNWSKLAMHEMGHALGLDHSPSQTSVMYPYPEFQADTPSPNDITTIRSLYY